MRLMSSAFAATVCAVALLTAPTVESRYLFGSASGGSHQREDHDAGAIQHVGNMNPPPYRGLPHGPHGPVGWPRGKHFGPGGGRLRSAGPGDLPLQTTNELQGPGQGDRRLRQRGHHGKL
jgi:hypothetical protein